MPHRIMRPRVAVVRSAAPGRDRLTASRTSLVLIAVGLLASLSTGLSASGAHAAVACDKYAAVKGSDAARGTSSAPFRTAQKLVDSLAAGQVGCLRAGTYAGGTNLFIRKAGITLSSASDQRATIKSRVYVQEGANGVTIRDLRLEGSPGFANVLVRADRTSWVGNEITNGRRNASCVMVGSRGHGSFVATSTRITGNRVHDCGNHGIYLSAGRNTDIIDNRIYDNGMRAVQLYPDSRGAMIEGNTMDDNGWGVVFSGTRRYASSNNIVQNNRITDSKLGQNIYGVWNSARRVGKGNVARGNCVWSSSRKPWIRENGGIQTPSKGFKARNNRVSAQCR